VPTSDGHWAFDPITETHIEYFELFGEVVQRRRGSTPLITSRRAGTQPPPHDKQTIPGAAEAETQPVSSSVRMI
jgi:hypothetical protein